VKTQCDNSPREIKVAKKSKNERNTENLVRDELRRLDYYDQNNNISVEEQKSVIDEVKRLLKNGSKGNKGGRGCPDSWLAILTPRTF